MSTDSEDIEDIEDEDELMFGRGGSGKKPLDLLESYLPEREDYGAKTVITKEQVHLLAGLEQILNFYPELEHREDVIIEWIAAYEKRMTSVHGLSRSEFLDILISMNGGSPNDEDSAGFLQRIMDADIGDEDD